MTAMRKTLIATALGLLVPAAADAQVMRPLSYGMSPYALPFGPNYYGFGSMGGWGGGGWGGGGLGGWGGMSGPSNSYFDQGWGYGSPFAYNSFNRAGPVLFPGFAAADPPRARPTFAPAIYLPPPAVIAAALSGNNNEYARLHLVMPASNAIITLDGQPTQQTGTERNYITPKLQPNKAYTFQVVCTWRSPDGRNLRIRRDVLVTAGETTTIDFRKLSFGTEEIP